LAAANATFALKAAVWFLLGLLLIALLLFARQIMPHVGAGNPLIRLCRFVRPLLVCEAGWEKPIIFLIQIA